MFDVGDNHVDVKAEVYSEDGRNVIADINGASPEMEQSFANEMHDHVLLKLASRGHSIDNLEHPKQETIIQ